MARPYCKFITEFLQLCPTPYANATKQNIRFSKNVSVSMTKAVRSSPEKDNLFHILRMDWYLSIYFKNLRNKATTKTFIASSFSAHFSFFGKLQKYYNFICQTENTMHFPAPKNRCGCRRSVLQ